jgi:serine/threonine protein phosphatase PrpC
MSEKIKSKIKVLRLRHLKGNYSISNQYTIYNDNNRKLEPHHSSKKSRSSKTNSKHKKSVDSINNKSFHLRRKKNNEFDDINIKMITHKTMSKNTQQNKPQSKYALRTNNKKIYHNRIKSFEINVQDKDNNKVYNSNKTDRNNFNEKKNISINKIKINSFIGKKEGKIYDNEYSMDRNKSKNIIVKKTNSLLEDNESTKNTKKSEQKLINYDNYTTENKFLIVTHKFKNKNYNNINEKKKSKNNVLNNEDNRSISNRNKNKLNIKPNLGNLKKNNSIKREYGYTGISPPNKEESKEDIIQKIKDKIEFLKATIEENNNSGRDKANKEISYKYNDKTDLNNSKKGKVYNNNYNPKYEEKNIINKIKSPINLKLNYNNNLLLDSKKYFNSSAKKRNFKNKIKVYAKYNRNEKKNNIYNEKSSNSNYNINDNYLHQNQKKLFYNGTRSQQELMIDFIEKALNNEDNKNKNKSIKNKTKRPKDLAEKEIEKTESICKKGFLGADVPKTNQDNYFIYKNFMENPNYIFFGVCDGHGTFGHEVSGYLVYDIPLTINELLIKRKFKNISENNIPKIIPLLKKTFVQIDKNLSRDTKIDTTFSGSTCVSLIFTPSKLLCINVGDSRCIIGKFDEKKWMAKSLSFDHKPDLKLERERIIKNGGNIEPYINDNGEYYGPQRVWVKNTNVPGLAMSRSFGDVVAHSVGVSSEPDIIEYSFLEEDKFIILASDGIWEFLSNKECVDIVKDYYIRNDINGAINFLYKESTKRWIINEEIIDDITLIIIFLK